MKIVRLSLFSETTEPKAWQVIGNGMHVAQCLIVWLYIISCGACVAHVRMSGMVSCFAENDDEKDDGPEDDDCDMLGVARPQSRIAWADGQTAVVIDDD